MASFKFDHVHLFTHDAEAVARFYEHMFGAEVIRSVAGGQPRIDFILGGTTVFVLPVADDGTTASPPASPHLGIDHLGLIVSDLDAAVAELKAKGAEFTMEPTEIRPGVRISFVRGPDNVLIEILQRDPG